MMMASPRRAVLVIGGTGFFGRLLVRDILEHTELVVTTASRRGSRSGGEHERLGHVAVDLQDPGLPGLIAEHDLVVHAAGPFERMPLAPFEFHGLADFGSWTGAATFFAQLRNRGLIVLRKSDRFPWRLPAWTEDHAASDPFS